MSLRRGHLRSRVWAPPTHRDEWQDEAKCRGMMNDMISCEVCVDCPVKEPCGTLFDEIDVMLDDGTQRSLRMVGTWGGIEHGPGPTDTIGKPRTNIGECVAEGCDRKQATAHQCTMHYQRSKR